MRILSSPFPFVGRSNKTVLFCRIRESSGPRRESLVFCHRVIIDWAIRNGANERTNGILHMIPLPTTQSHRSSGGDYILVFAFCGQATQGAHSFRHASVRVLVASAHQAHSLTRRRLLGLIWFCPDSRAVKTEIITYDPRPALLSRLRTSTRESCQN